MPLPRNLLTALMIALNAAPAVAQPPAPAATDARIDDYRLWRRPLPAAGESRTRRWSARAGPRRSATASRARSASASRPRRAGRRGSRASRTKAGRCGRTAARWSARGGQTGCMQSMIRQWYPRARRAPGGRGGRALGSGGPAGGLRPQMPRQHQRRHAQPVRADVEGEAEQPCAAPGPSRCGRAGAPRTGGRRGGQAGQPAGRPACRRGGAARRSGAARPARSSWWQRGARARACAQKSGSAAANSRSSRSMSHRLLRPAGEVAVGEQMGGGVDDHVGRREDAQAVLQRDAVRDQRRRRRASGRAVSGRIVWWTSIIRSRVRWISGGSSCIQRR